MNYNPLLKKVLTFLVSVFTFHLVAAQQPYLIKDTNSNSGGAHSNPNHITYYMGNVYFTAESVNNGKELWKTDGTEAGTTMVKDINPGIGDSNFFSVFVFNNSLYLFIGYDLWKTDGTEEGTVLVTSFSGTVGGIVNRDTDFIFSNQGDGNGTELWKSDGTAEGTMIVKDINPGSANSNPMQLKNINGTIFFIATTSTHGLELWKSDGTEAGTMIVKDINVGSTSSQISNLTDVNGTLFFTINNREIWKTDGTEAGTVLIKDFLAGSSAASNFTDMNGTLFFTINTELYGHELWKTDGTEAGTILVKDILSGTESSYPDELFVFNGTLFFQASNQINGYELWKTDGTEAGTVMVKDINPAGNSNPQFMTMLNNTLYFSAISDKTYNMWKTDGTEAGTVIVSERVRPDLSLSAGSNLYFRGNDRVSGYELWKTDGTDAGTVLLKDINQGTGAGNPVKMAGNNDGLVFISIDDGIHGREFWKSDGTPEGTVMVKDINVGTSSTSSEAYMFTTANGITFFRATTATYGTELWKTDGTEQGTVLVKDIRPGTNHSLPTNLINVNGVLFFTANDGTNGNELWKSDGTSSGTVMVKDIRSGSGSSDPSELVNVNGVLFFLANNGSGGIKLYKSDGTSSGTVIVKELAGTSALAPHSLTSMNGTLYFKTYTTTYGIELWKSNGTEAGTVIVKDIKPGVGGSSTNSYPITNVNGNLYFLANVSGTYDLWKSDGTEGGTVMIKSISPDNFSGARDFTWFNNAVYFAVANPTNGYELWKTDGTDAGTVMVKDINSGTGHSSPNYLTVYNNVLYFIANDGIHGAEIWKSDGTEAGTVLLKDIYPGSDGAGISEPFVIENGKIYFSATAQHDGFSYGKELWSLGFCTSSNKLIDKLNLTSVFNNYVQTSPATASCQCDIFNNLISTVDASGPNPFTGEINSKAWIEKTTPTNFVKRHYEITPATDITTATGKITLYFTQAEFDAYNTAVGVSDPKLPTGSDDTQGIINLLVEKYNGTSSNETGLPNSYTGSPSLIDPVDTDIVWNATANRWEVTFATTGFGGFFVKAAAFTLEPPTNVAVNKTSVCTGNEVTLSATCATGTVTWYTEPIDGTAIGTGNSLNHSPIVTTTYYASCENSSDATTRVATSTVNATITPMPPLVYSINKSSTCIGSSITLTGSCLSGTPVWYTQATGGTSVGTGTTSSQSPTVTTTYYMACEYTGCFSTIATVGTVTIVSPPDAPTNVAVNKTSICAADPVTLTATCSTGIVAWYNLASGGVAVGTGSALVQNPAITTTYYAACQDNDCESSRVATASVVIAPKPAAPVVISNKTEICEGDNAILNILVAGLENFSVAWTNGLTGNSIMVTPLVTTSYKASLTINGCASDSSSAFVLQVKDKPQSPVITANNMALCKGNSSILSAQCPNTDAAFYWTTPILQTNTPLNPMNTNQRLINEPGEYKGYCEAPTGCMSNETTITITQKANCNGQDFITILPERPVVCPGKSVTLSASGCSGVVTWAIGTSTQTGTSVSVSPTITTTYVAQCSTGGGASINVEVAVASRAVDHDIITGKEYVRVTDTLESDKKVGDPAYTPAPNVVFEAGKSILLKPGFVAETRSTFRAEIKGCN